MRLTPFISLRCVLSSTLLFIAGPLRTSQTHLHHRLHPVWSLSSFSTGSRGRRKPVEEKRCRDRTTEGAHVSSHSGEAAKVSSCVVLWSSSSLLKSSSAAVRVVAWCCYWEATSAEGEGSRARCAVPRAVSNEFVWGADRRDDFAVTHFGLCASVDPRQCWQMGMWRKKKPLVFRFNLMQTPVHCCNVLNKNDTLFLDLRHMNKDCCNPVYPHFSGTPGGQFSPNLKTCTGKKYFKSLH